MQNKLLTIAFATMPHRPKPFLERIKKLMPEWCELLIDDDPDICLGLKRNNMLRKANGKYIAVIDDDDDITDDYFTEIKLGIDKGVDSIGIMIERNVANKKIIQKCGMYHPTMADEVLWMGHFSPVKTELARKATYRDFGMCEDADHVQSLAPLIKTAHYVEHPIYWQYYHFTEKEYNRFTKFTGKQINALPTV